MLLEAQIVSKMALLFGTTWVVNAIVVSGLLCLIVAANLFYGAMPRIPLWIPYAGLFLSLAVMFAVPVEKLFFEVVARARGRGHVWLCVFPCFLRASFSSPALPEQVFAEALSDRTCSVRCSGGLLESFSLWFGLGSLAILAAVLYLGSALFLRRGTGWRQQLEAVSRPTQSK